MRCRPSLSLFRCSSALPRCVAVLSALRSTAGCVPRFRRAASVGLLARPQQPITAGGTGNGRAPARCRNRFPVLQRCSCVPLKPRGRSDSLAHSCEFHSPGAADAGDHSRKDRKKWGQRTHRREGTTQTGERWLSSPFVHGAASLQTALSSQSTSRRSIEACRPTGHNNNARANHGGPWHDQPVVRDARCMLCGQINGRSGTPRQRSGAATVEEHAGQPHALSGNEKHEPSLSTPEREMHRTRLDASSTAAKSCNCLATVLLSLTLAVDVCCFPSAPPDHDSPHSFLPRSRRRITPLLPFVPSVRVGRSRVRLLRRELSARRNFRVLLLGHVLPQCPWQRHDHMLHQQ